MIQTTLPEKTRSREPGEGEMDQDVLSGEKTVSSPSGGPGLTKVTTEDSSGVFNPRQVSHTSRGNVSGGNVFPNLHTFLVTFTWWSLPFGAKVCMPGAQNLQCRLSLLCNPPPVAARSEGPHQPFGGLALKRSFVHFSLMKVAVETMSFKFSLSPKRTQHLRLSIPCQCPNQQTPDVSLYTL